MQKNLSDACPIAGYAHRCFDLPYLDIRLEGNQIIIPPSNLFAAAQGLRTPVDLVFGFVWLSKGLLGKGWLSTGAYRSAGC